MVAATERCREEAEREEAHAEEEVARARENQRLTKRRYVKAHAMARRQFHVNPSLFHTESVMLREDPSLLRRWSLQ